ncbi:MAG: hypothetical protein AAGA10_20790 [Bacteroidota bacterium]
MKRVVRALWIGVCCLWACAEGSEEAFPEDFLEQTAFQKEFEGVTGRYLSQILIERREWDYDENGNFDPIEDSTWIRDTLLAVSFFSTTDEFIDSTVFIGKYVFKLLFPREEPQFLPKEDAVTFSGVSGKFPYEPELLEYGSFQGGSAYFFTRSDSLSFILASFNTRRCTETWYGTGKKLP